jgi:hypothetical protein
MSEEQRMPKSLIAAGVLVFGATFTSPALAQEQVSDSLEQLRQSLKPSQAVRVTDASGRTVEGRISELSDTTLALLVDSTWRRKGSVQSVPRDEIVAIHKPDGLENGLLIGLAAGIAANWVFVRANCGRPGYDPECSANVGVVGLPIFVSAGVAVGMLIDKAITRTLYRAPRKR